MKRVLAVAVFVAGPAVWADEVFLRGGGSIHGEVVHRTAASIVMEVGPGRMTLPMSRVDRIVAATSDLSIYRERAARMAPSDAAGWLTLARWAEGRELLTQAKGAYERVVAIDPENAAANTWLGRVRMADRWVSPEEAYRARGFIRFEGNWVTPEERGAIVADRAAEARARELTAGAEARAREAEARARTAEAEAQRAQAEAQAASNGIPYPYVYGGVGAYGGYGGYGGVYGPGGYGGSRGPYGHRDHPAIVIVAPAPPPTRDEAGASASHRQRRSRQNH